MIRGRSSKSYATSYLLEALLPYSQANSKEFNRSHFFKQLEVSSRIKGRTYQNAFYKLKKQGLIEIIGGVPRITAKGRAYLRPYQPKELTRANIMVVFDIPEVDRYKRRKLRVLLRELRFQQVQKSVWVTKYECKEILEAEIRDLNLEEHLRIFEAVEITS